MADVMITLTGNAPLVMHNDRMADPLNEHTRSLKLLTSKRTKTESDHSLIARTEFEGALYHDDEKGPYIPSDNVLRCLVEAGKLRKPSKGPEVKRTVIIINDILPLHYEGPRGIDELFEAGFFYRKSVGINQKRVMKTRPRFEEWSLSVPAVIDTTRLDLDLLRAIIADAGEYIGLGERRPMFGRFLGVLTTR